MDGNQHSHLESGACAKKLVLMEPSGLLVSQFYKRSSPSEIKLIWLSILWISLKKKGALAVALSA